LNKGIKRNFLTGLAVTIPTGLTIISIMDDLLKIVPRRFHPESAVGFHMPEPEIIFTALLTPIISTGSALPQKENKTGITSQISIT
jgi:uncharacterized membrane protein